MSHQLYRTSIISNNQMALDTYLIHLKIPENYPIPFIAGQYLELIENQNEKSYFAIASPPSQNHTMEILVKKSEGFAGRLVNLTQGEFQVSPPLGKGFQVENLKNRDILMACIGTAIAPIRSFLKTVLEKRNDFGTLVLFYGIRTPEELCFKSEFAAWQENGVQIQLVYSGGKNSHSDRQKEYVQNRIKKLIKDGNHFTALIAGNKNMVQETKSVCSEIGVPENFILTNY